MIASTEVDARKIWWAGPLTVVAAVLAVFAVRVAAFGVLDLPADFPPLTYGGLGFFTAVLVSAGVLVFAAVCRWSAAPIPTYRRIALVALILSLLPDAYLPGRVPGATWTIAVVLMVTHVAAWLPTVLILTNPSLISESRGR